MGSEKVKRAIRKRAALLIFLGCILFFGMGFIAFAFAMIGELGGMFVFSVAVAAFGAWIIWFGARQCSMKSCIWLKRNPELLKQADELYSSVVYENKYILYSFKHVGCKRNPINIAAFDEIIGFYERKTRYNFLITIQKELVIVTRRGEMSVSIYSDKKIEELIELISSRAFGAKIGYDPVNAEYFRQEQKAYKKSMKSK